MPVLQSLSQLKTDMIQLQTALNILLADDDKDERYLFEKALKELPVKHHLTTVPDGTKLMSYLSRNLKSLPDVIFLDINMPGKNGHECLAEIRGAKKFKQIPVVIYSAILHAELADTLYKNGANYFLNKSGNNQLALYLQNAFTLLAENTRQPAREAFILQAAASSLPNQLSA